jgi:hypothetical protein
VLEVQLTEFTWALFPAFKELATSLSVQTAGEADALSGSATRNVETKMIVAAISLVIERNAPVAVDLGVTEKFMRVLSTICKTTIGT